MDFLATHNTNRVYVIGSLFDSDDNLKIVYINSDGEIDEDHAANFTIEDSELWPINEE